MNKLASLASIIIVICLAVVAVAQSQSAEAPDRSGTLFIDSKIINAPLTQADIDRIKGRNFIYDVYIDREANITYVVYFNNQTEEKMRKINLALEDLERQYNPIQLPYYVRDAQGNLRRCDIGTQNAIQCPLT